MACKLQSNVCWGLTRWSYYLPARGLWREGNEYPVLFLAHKVTYVWYILFLNPQEPALLPPWFSAGLGHNPVFTLWAWKLLLLPQSWPQEMGSIHRRYFCCPTIDKEAELTLTLCSPFQKDVAAPVFHSGSKNHSCSTLLPCYSHFIFGCYSFCLPNSINCLVEIHSDQ